jgi:hypothetical protein
MKAAIVALLLALALAAPAGATPTARFTWSPTTPQTGQTVTFDGTTSSCDRAPCTYTWDDSGGQLGASPTCQGSPCTALTTTFNFTGTKNARLTVKNHKNQTSQVTHPVDVAAPPSGLLWTADADTPGTWDPVQGDPGPEWASTSQVRDHCIDRVSAATDPQGVRQGTYSYKFDATSADLGVFDTVNVRCELGQGNPSRPGFEDRLEPRYSDLYYGFSLQSVSEPQGDWQLGGLQDHTIAPSGWPQVSMVAWGGNRFFQNNHEECCGGPGGTLVWNNLGVHPLLLNTWQHYVVRIYHDVLPNGILQVWERDQGATGWTMIVDKPGIHTYADSGAESHVRIGIYSAPNFTGNQTRYVDAFRVGTDFASVDPCAVGNAC